MNEMEMLDDKKDISKTTVIELALKKDKNDNFFSTIPLSFISRANALVRTQITNLVKLHQRNIYERLGLRTAQDVRCRTSQVWGGSRQIINSCWLPQSWITF
jgi:hypothetical protein